MISLPRAHEPVMLEEVIHYMSPKDGEVYVDGTFGAGGYSKALLESADCKVIAIDRDPSVKKFADELEQLYPGRIQLALGSFGDMEQLLASVGVSKVDGVVLDVGVSSMQLDEGERGFSFMKDGPLDMRMSQEGMSAEDFVNSAKETDLADVIYKYGDERKSRQIARAIVHARAEAPITSTKALAAIIHKAVKVYNDKIDPATRTFQALRIWVNDELGELTRALESATRVLNTNGRLVVVSFHSLEDRIVKRFLAGRSGKGESINRHMPIELMGDERVTEFSLLSRRACKPGDDEVKQNPRARSAKLRAAKRLGGGEAL